MPPVFVSLFYKALLVCALGILKQELEQSKQHF